jgi:hypothetical protein
MSIARLCDAHLLQQPAASCIVQLFVFLMCRRITTLCAAQWEAIQALAAQLPAGELRKWPSITNDLLSTLAVVGRLGPVSCLGPPLYDLLRQATQALERARQDWPAAAALLGFAGARARVFRACTC